MPGSLSRSTSVRTRLRQLTTLACALTLLAALAALSYGHLVHGTLLMLGALTLLPGSLWGRRHRQSKRGNAARELAQDLTPSQLQAQQLRKAA